MFDKKPTVAIVDYGMGNMFSVRQACSYVGFDPVITADKDVILKSDAAILPGVGAFGEAMRNLIRLDIASPIKDFIETGKPFMGICLGFQLLFSESEEFGVNKGLNVFPGVVKKFIGNSNDRVPQIGWNRIYMNRQYNKDSQIESLFSGISCGEFMYFVHSFYVLTSEEIISTTTTYAGINYCSSVFRGNLFASQFHPEKSGKEGMKIYKNWYDAIIKHQELLCLKN